MPPLRNSTYSNNVYIIDDPVRKAKLITFFKTSVDQDLKRWSISHITSKNLAYQSPSYNGNYFCVDMVLSMSGSADKGIVYIYETKPPAQNCNKQCVFEWDNNAWANLNADNSKYIKKLRDNVFADDIKELEGLIGTNIATQRRNKLRFLEKDELREKLEASYNNWMVSPTQALAEQIAMTANAFYRFRSFPYTEWYTKFALYDDVINEIKKYDIGEMPNNDEEDEGEDSTDV